MPPSFSGEEFLQALASDSIPVNLPLIGMAKKSDADNSIEFAPGTSCQNWTTIPIAMIATVETIRQVPCDDHTHHLVRLTLKDPGTPEFAVLTSLLSAVQQSTGGCGSPSPPQPPQPITAVPQPPMGMATPQQQQAVCTDGYSFCDRGTCWACCHGYWHIIGDCVVGRNFNCNGVNYNAVGCWPIW